MPGMHLGKASGGGGLSGFDGRRSKGSVEMRIDCD